MHCGEETGGDPLRVTTCYGCSASTAEAAVLGLAARVALTGLVVDPAAGR